MMQTYHYELDLDSINSNSLIASQIVPGSIVLEFGPAYGRLTKYMHEELSCIVDLVELDQEAGSKAMVYARTACLGDPDGDIEKYRWETILDGRTYDYIIFADVLEHLRCPQKVLSVCRQYLKVQGVILCSVPNIAHSSVIISLWNGDFPYYDTGLLDRTHVHFFTKKTFSDMVCRCGYEITDIQEIVSGVGENEIRYTYDMVPDAVESGLRFRMEGEVYQYFFRLQKSESCKAGIQKAVYFGSRGGYSCICYIKQKGDADFSSGKYIEKRYLDKLVDVYFDLRTFSDIEGLCIKLIEKSAFVKIKKIELDGILQPIEANGQTIGEGLYVFPDEARVYLRILADVPASLHLQYEVTVIEADLAHEIAKTCGQEELHRKCQAEEYRQLEQKLRITQQQVEELRRMNEQYRQELHRKEEELLEELLGAIAGDESE